MTTGAEAILRYPGSKWRLARWIAANLPRHTSYLEPYFGSGAVFFTKAPSRVETINDLDGQVVNLFRALRERSGELADLVEATPWSRQEYYLSYETTGEDLEDARRFLVRCWQAFGSKTSDRTGWRNDVQGRQHTSCARIWRKLPDRLLAAANRLKDAQIENRPALEIIESHRQGGVLIYADPPYILGTRKGKRLYKHEMTDQDHVALLEALDAHPGPVVLSGYASPLYDERLARWGRKTAKATAERGLAREEVLWLNPVAMAQLGTEQLTLDA
ncbi:MAG: DNA adenine methylase [Symbiobacteriia bacterium]